jgi:hypothetical protein
MLALARTVDDMMLWSSVSEPASLVLRGSATMPILGQLARFEQDRAGGRS